MSAFCTEYHNSRHNIIILFWNYAVDIRKEAWLNLFWEYINGKLFAVQPICPFVLSKNTLQYTCLPIL